MAIEIATLKAAVIDADARARVWLSDGRLDAVEGGYEILFTTLNALLGADEAHLFGWQRCALVLTDMRQRLKVDALAAGRGPVFQMRAAALLDLPDLVRVTGMGDIHDALRAAINLGAPRYNAGDIRGCARLYWVTIQSVLAAPATRGFAGHARALAVLRAVVEGDIPALPLDAAGMDEFAWSLRRAIDASLAISG